MGRKYACKCMCGEVSNNAWYREFGKSEEVSKRGGELSNSKIFLRGWSDAR
jgi:hypothetical protein